MSGAKKIKRIYLDVCTVCRPYDDQNQIRIRLETEATHLILNHMEQGRFGCVISPVHFAEVNAIADFQERFEILSFLNRFRKELIVDDRALRNRAEELHLSGFGLADAAHLAYAEAFADILITCDDKFLKKCQKTDALIPVYNPIDFVVKEELQ